MSVAYLLRPFRGWTRLRIPNGVGGNLAMMNDLDSRITVVLRIVAVSLVGAALLILGSGFAAIFTYAGAPIRDRLFYGIERGGGPFPMTLGLAAALIAVLCARLSEQDAPWMICSRVGASVVAGIVIGASAYSIWYVVSLHVSIPGPNSSAGVILSFGERTWGEKVTEILHDASAILLGGVTVWAVRRSRPSRTDDRDIFIAA